MPPRGKTEGLLTNVASPASPFQDEKFIEQLIHYIAESDDASLVGSTASALGVEDYLVNLKNQIILDVRLDFLRFCAKQKYAPLQIVHLITWMDHFQAVVGKKGSMDEMRRELMDFVATEIEEGWKWRQAPPAVENPVETHNPPKAGTKKGARVAEKAAVEDAEATAALPRENIYLSKEAVGPFCTYLLHGIIQHASLHVYVASHERETSAPKDFSFFIEILVSASPLRPMMTLEKVCKESSSVKPDTMRELRESELAGMVNEYEEAVAKEELWRKTRQIEDDMKILIENEGTKTAVESTYEGLEADLTQRQRNILRRIAALEKTLFSEPSP